MQNTFKKKVLFVGMPDMALVCLPKLVQAGVNIVGVVPPPRDNETYPVFIQLVNSLNLRLVEYENSFKEQMFLNKVKILEPDIAVVCSYNKLFPKEFLAVVKDGFINVHPSLLPDYRGGNPYSHVIMNKERETGITLHFMDETFDTGDMISQVRTKIEKYETMGTLFNRLNYMAADALLQALTYYEIKSALPRNKQPEGEFKKAGLIEARYGHTTIDWTKSAEDIEAFIRALNPFLTAITTYRGVFVKLFAADFKCKKTKHEPGTICEIKNGVGVACADGVVHIRLLQVGSYVIGDAKDFVKIFDPKIGEKFI